MKRYGPCENENDDYSVNGDYYLAEDVDKRIAELEAAVRELAEVGYSMSILTGWPDTEAARVTAIVEWVLPGESK